MDSFNLGNEWWTALAVRGGLNFGVGDGDRTHGHQGHNLALYLAELHPPYSMRSQGAYLPRNGKGAFLKNGAWLRQQLHFASDAT